METHSNFPFITKLFNSDHHVKVILFTAGFIFILILHKIYRPYTFQGVYYQQWSSEHMMQTVSIIDLREEPIKSILFLHIQPPLFDSIRMLISRLWMTSNYEQLIIKVDQAIYILWGMIYSLMVVMTYQILNNINVPRVISCLGAIIFLLHPASIFYTTFLEGTLLTSFGVLWLYNGFTQIREQKGIFGLAFPLILLYFVRSIFQWQAFIVVFISLTLLGMHRKELLSLIFFTGVIIIAYSLKQYIIFGSPSTSSFGGSSCLHSIGIFPDMGKTQLIKPDEFNRYLDSPFLQISKYPNVLTRILKPNGIPNFNYIGQLETEKEFFSSCLENLKSKPIQNTFFSYLQNLWIFLRPSSEYLTPHMIADNLPWRELYNYLFSSTRLIILLTLSGIIWLLRRSKKDLNYAIGMALPIIYTVAVCLFFEKLENMRYKFFVEPILSIFIMSQIYFLINMLVKNYSNGMVRFNIIKRQ